MWHACVLALLAGSVVNATSEVKSLRSGPFSSNDTVHVVFSNHLDIGFGGLGTETAYDTAVINRYFDEHFPRAIALGAHFAATPGPEQHVFTAHAFLASLYLDCPLGMGLHCPTAAQQLAFCAAAVKGWISWSALPANLQVDMVDEFTMVSAAHLAFYTDAACGLLPKTVMSLRGVPGFTRNLLQSLTQFEDVRALSIGVDPHSAPPAVPHNTPFKWVDPANDNASMIVFVHPFGDGGMTPADPPSSGPPIPLTPPEDCTYAPAVPGRPALGRDILCFSWRGVNEGPLPDAAAVSTVFNAARRGFPGATVQASTLELFVHKLHARLEAAPEGLLPVVTSEMGDTWIGGVASDPVKAQHFRAIQRMRSSCLLSSSCTAQDPAFRNFTRLFLKLPEHTWGLDTREYPASFNVWDNESFRNALQEDDKFQVAEQAWQRQSQYVTWSIQALHASTFKSHTAFAASLSNVLDDLSPETAHPVLEHLLRGGRSALPRCPERSLDPFVLDDASQDAEAAQPTRHRTGQGESSELQTLDDEPGAQARHIGAGDSCGEQELVLQTQHWRVAVDKTSGAVTSFRRIWQSVDGTDEFGTDWAAGGKFAELVYSTYTEAHNAQWRKGYCPDGGDSDAAKHRFGKPGMDEHAPQLRDRSAVPRFLAWSQGPGPSDGEQDVVLRFGWPEDPLGRWPITAAGAPPEIDLIIRSWDDTSSVMLDLLYRGKQPTRVSEALWLRFAPPNDVSVPADLKLGKGVGFMSPFDVVKNGSFSLHGVTDGGVLLPSQQNSWEVLQVIAMDAPVVAIGEPDVLPDVHGPPRPENGFNFCLFNNAAGTNYVMWTPYGNGVGAAIKSRFILTVRDSRQAAQPGGVLSDDAHLTDIPRHAIAEHFHRS